MGWIEDGTYDFKRYVLGNIQFAGLLIGSVVSTKLMGYFHSRGKDLRYSLYTVSIVMIISSAIKCIANFWAVSIGRFLFGIAAGCTNPMISKVITETIPNQSVQFYGLF